MSDWCWRNDRSRRGDGSRLDGRRWCDDGGRCGYGRRSDDRLRCDDGCGNGDGGSNDDRCSDGGRRGDRCGCGDWGRRRRGVGLDGQGRCLGKRRGLKCLSGFSLQAVAGCGRILLCQVARRWCVVVFGVSAAAACAQQQGRESKGQGLGNVRSAHGREVRKEWRRRIVDGCRTFRGVIRDREMLLPGGGQRP